MERPIQKVQVDRLPRMSLIDTGWAAWLPFELVQAYEALGSASARRELERRLQQPPDEASAERWERFRLVAPSPVSGSAPRAPRCSIAASIASARSTISRLRVPSARAIRPRPQASCSKRRS